MYEYMIQNVQLHTPRDYICQKIQLPKDFTCPNIQPTDNTFQSLQVHTPREYMYIYIMYVYIYEYMYEFMIQNVQLPTDRLYVSTHTADRQHKTYSCIF